MTDRGYDLDIRYPLERSLNPGDSLRMNLIVNEMKPDRDRRAGQLVLGGESGWVYLRGMWAWELSAPTR